MRTIESIEVKKSIEDESLEILKERKEFFENIESSFNNISKKEIELKEIKKTLNGVLEGLKNELSEDIYNYIFEVSEVNESIKPSKVYTFENSKNSLFFKITKEFLEGEKSLSVLASKFYEGVKYTKGEKLGTFRVIEGKPDLETISLTGRQIDENENKGLLIFKSRSSNSKGKVYAPVITGITEAGKKVYGDIKIGE